jgi:hypothetical protein
MCWLRDPLIANQGKLVSVGRKISFDGKAGRNEIFDS